MLSKQPGRAEAIRIHLIHEGIGVLRETGRKNYDLVILSHYSQEIVNSWTFLNKNLANITIYVDWNDEVGVLDLIKLTMD